jgi:hypothetical protein
VLEDGSSTGFLGDLVPGTYYDVAVTLTGAYFSQGSAPPAVEILDLPSVPIEVGIPFDALASFTDPDSPSGHTAVWDWGDGNSCETAFDADCTLSEESGEVTGSHAYAEPGVYTVRLTVIDPDLLAGGATFEYVVAYDPSGGFVTGGGWIDSPEGACPVFCGNATGKATFGFVSKYNKGAEVPSGQTVFKFKAGGLNLRSDSYDWLVVAGHKAQFKGTAKINGTGDYGFLVSAIDAELTPSTDVDLFRIKIWDKVSGDGVIYDNQMGQGEDADPTTAIGGGSIVIHKAKK